MTCRSAIFMRVHSSSNRAVQIVDHRLQFPRGQVIQGRDRAADLRGAEDAAAAQDLLVGVVEGAPAAGGDPVHGGDLPVEDGARALLVAAMEPIPDLDEGRWLAAA